MVAVDHGHHVTVIVEQLHPTERLLGVGGFGYSAVHPYGACFGPPENLDPAYVEGYQDAAPLRAEGDLAYSCEGLEARVDQSGVQDIVFEILRQFRHRHPADTIGFAAPDRIDPAER